MNASTFTARVIASTGADVAAALSGAVGALSGPLHGGAPARVLKMLDEVEQAGDAEQWVKDALDRGERLMGFGHRVYRAEDPRARVLRRTLEGARLDALRGRRGARGGGAGRAEGAQARPRARHQRRVLVGGRARLRRGPAASCSRRCSPARARPAGRRTSSSRSARARLIRPTAKYVGPGARPLVRRLGQRRLEDVAQARSASSSERPASGGGRRAHAALDLRRGPARPLGEHEHLHAAVVLGGAALDEAARLEAVDDPGDVGVVAVQRVRRARSSSSARRGRAASAPSSCWGRGRARSATAMRRGLSALKMRQNECPGVLRRGGACPPSALTYRKCT